MLLVGLTGGIGAGKSTVASMFAARGATVLDADAIVHEVQRPGTSVHRSIVERFGDDIVTADGSLDRGKLGAIVFTDDAARADLNAIVHPAVWEHLSAELDRLRGTDAIVVLDVPLLVEGRGKDLVDVVVVVEAPIDDRIARLEATRGMSADDARARMATQATDAERRARADHVIGNGGSLAELEAQIDDVWEQLQGKTT